MAPATEKVEPLKYQAKLHFLLNVLEQKPSNPAALSFIFNFIFQRAQAQEAALTLRAEGDEVIG